ncbi:hypothetical protein LARV_00323 [Longilinea arvoryzae]|uniref:Amidoligase enzyme n=1 Tax=Longilinea arvoryzae TaxID=360412 RepID=A0A0S7BFL4_9CHLR|nr:hypothetical protein [Longilinea arvoryzae]GAP12587.1 hypothetical protein LARV_00323 [Longilinea arvoryzae]
MKDPIFLRRSDLLSLDEASYWKRLLYQVTKIGMELEVATPKGIDRPSFEAAVNEALAPSGTFNSLGINGVLDVGKEHCGVEIRIIGRQPHFRSLQKQLSAIMGALLEKGGRARATCGLHFHLLTPGLAEPVPEIILANLWNLVRRYSPELRFLTSCGDTRKALCRRRNYTSHIEMIQHSPATMSMREIKEILKESKRVPEHQNFFNLQHVQFDDSGAVSDFHLEFRFPDADLSATSVSAKTFLFLALLLKAVDFSQYGVIHVGKIVPWRRKTYLLGILNNNDGNLATSDTSALTDEMIQELRQGCRELLDLLTPVFEGLDSEPALEVLNSLAEQPVSLLRCAGYDWQGIESLLSKRAAVDDLGLDETDRKLMQYIEVGEWSGLSSLESWEWSASRELYLTPQNLEQRLERLKALRGLRWDAARGSLLFTH